MKKKKEVKPQNDTFSVEDKFEKENWNEEEEAMFKSTGKIKIKPNKKKKA